MRYRLTVPDVLHKLFFSDSELNAVTKVTSRLVLHNYLNRYELYDPRSLLHRRPGSGPLPGTLAKENQGPRLPGPGAGVRHLGLLPARGGIPRTVTGA